MKKHALLTVLLLCITGLTLASCASINPTNVSDKDRDTTGSFDGRWTLSQHALRARQVVAQQGFKCKFSKLTRSMLVKDGVASISIGKYRGEGNVSSGGRFRIEIPTDRKFTNSTGVSSIGSEITYIFQGKLGEQKTTGLYTIGKKALNNGGCSTKLTISGPSITSMHTAKGRPATKRVIGEWGFTRSDVPGADQSSELSVQLSIGKEGYQYPGELAIEKRMSSDCGPLISTSNTKVTANLIASDRLLLQVKETSDVEVASCNNKSLRSKRYFKDSLILLILGNDKGKPQLAFKSDCGWKNGSDCIFEMPPLDKIN